jgi:hypothetical protein
MTIAQPLLIPLQIVLIFFLSHLTISELFYFLRIFLKKEKLIYAFVSLLFFPGTVIHEMGHFVAATILNLRVHEVRLLPSFEKNQIKLGSVLYEKKDFIRGILVGIAPIFFALVFFWFLGKFHLFPNTNLWLNILLGYIVFAVSSTMFSSKQDLIEFVLIVPVIIIIIGIIYIFNIKLDIILNNKLLKEGFIGFFQDINFYLLFSLIANIILIIFFKIFRILLHK